MKRSLRERFKLCASLRIYCIYSMSRSQSVTCVQNRLHKLKDLRYCYLLLLSHEIQTASSNKKCRFMTSITERKPLQNVPEEEAEKGEKCQNVSDMMSV